MSSRSAASAEATPPEAHRHDENHRQGERPALVLRRQHEEDEHDAQGKDVNPGAAGLDLEECQHAVAETLVGLHVDLPGAAKLVEVVDVKRADVDLERRRPM